ncbi:MAG: FGGY-family carbohydrate kinase [Bacillota bacterium]|nr:FGGY-family carbohydrate kinase [Bacillota bacterium]
MSKRLLLGIDIGTSGCKIAAFDFDGNAVCTYTRSYDVSHPDTTWAEIDADLWWSSICGGIRALIESERLDPNEVAAVGVDGLSWTCLPVDRKGRPLRPAMIWLDRRAEEQAQWMKKQVGEDRLISLSGNPVDPAYVVPKMLWLKQHEPDIYADTHMFLQSNSYVVYKLTGVFSQDHSQAYGFHFFDIANCHYDESAADRLGISLDLIPPLTHCHEVVGTVTSKASRECGLPKGVPVVAGGLDAACCTLGAGAVRAGQTQEQGGSSGGMSIVVDKPLIHPKLILGCHVVPGLWLLQGGTVGGGGTLRWFDEQLGACERQIGLERGISSFEVMSEEAGQIGPGSEGLVFLPYMAGERSPIWDSTARGVLFGLSYDKTRAHIIRAIMEGVGYSLLHNLKTAEEVKAEVGVLLSVGGSANSRVWTQIKSDITNKPIHVPASDHATTLGAALIAGVGIGVYRDFQSAVDNTVRIQRVHEPDELAHQMYRGYYRLYLDLYDRLKDHFRQLDSLRTRRDYC